EGSVLGHRRDLHQDRILSRLRGSEVLPSWAWEVSSLSRLRTGPGEVPSLCGGSEAAPVGVRLLSRLETARSSGRPRDDSETAPRVVGEDDEDGEEERGGAHR